MRNVTSESTTATLGQKQEISCSLGGAQKALFERIVEELETLVASIGEQSAAALISKIGPSSHPDKPIGALGQCGSPALRQVLRLRAHRALEDVMDALPAEVLLEAAAASHDLEGLILAVSSGALQSPAAQRDPLAAAKLLAFEHKRQLVHQAAPLLKVSEVQKILGVTRQAIDKRRERGSLIALRIGHQWLYPQLQFDVDGTGQVYPALAKVLAIHRDDSVWVVLDSLLAQDPAFGGKTLLDVVREGRIDLIDLYERQMLGDGFV